jgi:hypothetical protein
MGGGGAEVGNVYGSGGVAERPPRRVCVLFNPGSRGPEGLGEVVRNGRRQHHLPQPPRPLDLVQIRSTTAITKCLQLDVCAEIPEGNLGLAIATAAAVAQTAATTSAVAQAIGALVNFHSLPPRAHEDPFRLR